VREIKRRAGIGWKSSGKTCPILLNREGNREERGKEREAGELLMAAARIPGKTATVTPTHLRLPSARPRPHAAPPPLRLRADGGPASAGPQPCAPLPPCAFSACSWPLAVLCSSAMARHLQSLVFPSSLPSALLLVLPFPSPLWSAACACPALCLYCLLE